MLGVDGIYCDVCEKKLKHYVHLPATTRGCNVWGWYEGHASCLKTLPRGKNVIFGRRVKKKYKED
jgi:hypothetical protein